MYKSTLLAMAVAMAQFAAAAATAATPLPNRSVDTLDLARYSGQWHEIARLPMYFQRKCVDSVTANYTVEPDGTIEVRNACRTADGSIDESIGAARPVEGQPGQLEVRFAPRWLGWLPMVWADYWVVDLDPDYQWAVVGGPDRKYMWILSRAPTMDAAVFERIKADAHRRGYPVDRLTAPAVQPPEASGAGTPASLNPSGQ